MKKPEINKLIREQMLCRIGFKGYKYPYLAQFQYVTINESLYFHFTDYGKKMKLLERDNRVCIGIEMYRPDLSEYKFVVLRGRLEVVIDPKERLKAIEKFAKECKKRLSDNFLVAHGFRKEEGWQSFTPEKSLEIVKLVDIAEAIGFKYPASAAKKSRAPVSTPV
jgi:nitroimidazol reductase NimA-like FMN-containing flavoprotein (pyridoxamine 5'-phosphate oxidase superfamily)